MMGTWYERTPNGPFPYVVVAVHVTFTFELDATGPVATMRLVPGAIDLDVHGHGMRRVVDGPQEGVAHYAPSSSSCTPGGPTSGEVTAALTLA